jgi:hypothetical protein
MSIEKLKEMLREAFKSEIESVDRLNRAADGYGETEFEEDADRLRRAADGYGETEFEEDVAIVSDDETIPDFLNGLNQEDESKDMPPLANFLEKAPEGKESEEFVMKNKQKFKKQYGDKGQDVLNATATKLFKKEK